RGPAPCPPAAAGDTRRDECSQRHCPHRRTSGPGTDLKTTEPPQHSPPAPVSRSQIIGLIARHLNEASGAAARPGSARSLDPPGHEPQTWQLSGKQETPVTHAQSSRQNPPTKPSRAARLPSVRDNSCSIASIDAPSKR